MRRAHSDYSFSISRLCCAIAADGFASSPGPGPGLASRNERGGRQTVAFRLFCWRNGSGEGLSRYSRYLGAPFWRSSSKRLIASCAPMCIAGAGARKCGTRGTPDTLHHISTLYGAIPVLFPVLPLVHLERNEAALAQCSLHLVIAAAMHSAVAPRSNKLRVGYPAGRVWIGRARGGWGEFGRRRDGAAGCEAAISAGSGERDQAGSVAVSLPAPMQENQALSDGDRATVAPQAVAPLGKAVRFQRLGMQGGLIANYRTRGADRPSIAAQAAPGAAIRAGGATPSARDSRSHILSRACDLKPGKSGSKAGQSRFGGCQHGHRPGRIAENLVKPLGSGVRDARKSASDAQNRGGILVLQMGFGVGGHRAFDLGRIGTLRAGRG